MAGYGHVLFLRVYGLVRLRHAKITWPISSHLDLTLNQSKIALIHIFIAKARIFSPWNWDDDNGSLNILDYIIHVTCLARLLQIQ